MHEVTVMKCITGLALLLPAAALSACLGTSSCYAKGSTDTEPASADFDFCGTVVRWEGEADQMRVVGIGDRVTRWEQWTLGLPTPPNERQLVIAVSFNAPATARSPFITEGGDRPMANHATGPMSTSDYLSFCRHEPAEAWTVYLSFAAEASGFVHFPTHLRSC